MMSFFVEECIICMIIKLMSVAQFGSPHQYAVQDTCWILSGPIRFCSASLDLSKTDTWKVWLNTYLDSNICCVLYQVPCDYLSSGDIHGNWKFWCWHSLQEQQSQPNQSNCDIVPSVTPITINNSLKIIIQH